MKDCHSVQFSSVAQSCPTLGNPMNLSTPGLPVHHHLQEFTQTHVHQVGNAIQPSHPLSSPFFLPPIPPSIRVFSNESTLHMGWPNCHYIPIVLKIEKTNFSALLIIWTILFRKTLVNKCALKTTDDTPNTCQGFPGSSVVKNPLTKQKSWLKAQHSEN